MTEEEVAAALQRAEAALARLAGLDDAGRPVAEEALEAVVAVYAEGLRRMLAATPEAIAAVAADELVGHLLVLHGLHPDPVEVRVERALDEVRPYLHGHGGDVSLAGIDGGVARLRLVGSCNGCPSSAATLQQTVEEAVLCAAPELAGVVAEGSQGAVPAGGLIPVESLSRRPSQAAVG